VNFTQVVPLSSIALGIIGPQIVLPKLDPTQALRIIAGAALAEDAANTGKLSVLGSSCVLTTPLGNLCRTYAGGIAGQIVGASGIRWGWIDDEFIYGNDYLEIAAAVGDPTGQFKVVAGCDVSNSDGAAAHTITMQLSLLVEIYQTVLETPL